MATVLFCGDTVLGEGSVFIPPGDDSMREYFDTLRRLRQLDLSALCPGHGPVVWEPHEKLDEYIEHRSDRERRLVAALDAGARSQSEMLDAAWSEVPRGAAAGGRADARGAPGKAWSGGTAAGGVERLRY